MPEVNARSRTGRAQAIRPRELGQVPGGLDLGCEVQEVSWHAAQPKTRSPAVGDSPHPAARALRRVPKGARAATPPFSNPETTAPLGNSPARQSIPPGFLLLPLRAFGDTS